MITNKEGQQLAQKIVKDFLKEMNGRKGFDTRDLDDELQQEIFSSLETLVCLRLTEFNLGRKHDTG